jgi:hypothetical protein
MKSKDLGRRHPPRRKLKLLSFAVPPSEQLSELGAGLARASGCKAAINWERCTVECNITDQINGGSSL